MSKELQATLKKVIAHKAVKLLVEASEILDDLRGEGDKYEHVFCHVIMALSVMTPDAPMPQQLADTLKRYGLTPLGRVFPDDQIDEEYAKVERECNCDKCTAKRQEKSANAPAPGTIQ